MMHSRLLTTICIALLTLAAGRLPAQDISLGGRLGGVGGGVWFEDDEANDMIEPMLGLQLGGVAAFELSSLLSAQAEIWYIQKGWTETRAGGRRRLSYVELPVFLTATAPWSTAPQLIVGASVSLELGCSVTGVPEAGSVGCDDRRVEWRHTTTQFGTWFGLGVRRRFGVSYIDLQLLGNLNLTNLNREPLPRGYTRLLSVLVSAAYLVPLGRSAP